MLKIIGIVLEIIWSIAQGIMKQNEAEKKKREGLHEEAKKAWEGSDTRRAVDRVWSKLRR